MEAIKISAEVRTGKGTKKELSGIRASLNIPGVIYGGAKPPVKMKCSERELMAARKKGGVNAILNVTLDGSTETVIVKELQYHPVTDRPWHADFQRISLTRKIEARVPLHIKGEAPGVKLGGGVLQHELRAIGVKALPAEIPQYLEVDVSSLEIGQHILVKDLKVPAALEVLDNPDHIVLHVTIVKIIEETPTPEAVAAAAAAAGAAAAAAEPESSSTKGKKDEEGKVIPKAAGAPPAPEKGKEKKAS